MPGGPDAIADLLKRSYFAFAGRWRITRREPEKPSRAGCASGQGGRSQRRAGLQPSGGPDGVQELLHLDLEQAAFLGPICETLVLIGDPIGFNRVFNEIAYQLRVRDSISNLI
jgi:hypothetical protein